MHIPDNYLSPETCTVMAAAALPVLAISIYKVKKELPVEKVSVLGVGAAFSFLVMMFNIPLPGGTTGHAVGGTLIAMLLGPYAACISITVTLILQAFLFGDGGILSLGANIFNIAIVLPFTGYFVYQLCCKFLRGEKREWIAGGIGSYIGINAAAFCAGVEFGIQPMLFHDAAGNALYCPYPLSVSIPAMMLGHLTILGIAEVVFTIAMYAFIQSSAPQMLIRTEKTKSPIALRLLLAALICAVPIGLLAEGTAWGEWSKEELQSFQHGILPAGMQQGMTWHSFLPEYSLSGMPAWLSYILSAAIGASLCVIVFKLLSSHGKKAHHEA